VSPLVEELRARQAADVLRAYTFAHQEWMIRTVSGPLIASALRLIANGLVDLDAANFSGHDTSWRLEIDGLLPERSYAVH
jgi:hypothetical protein